jgi:hypothetical protein
MDEWHSHSSPVQQGITMIKTGVGKADEVSSKEFRLEFARRQREKQLIGLDGGEIDVDALAERLAAVVPSQLRVSAESGMIWIRNGEGHGVGIAVAAMANDDGESLEERVCRAARHAWRHRRTGSRMRPPSHGPLARATCRAGSRIPTPRSPTNRSGCITAPRAHRSWN